MLSISVITSLVSVITFTQAALTAVDARNTDATIIGQAAATRPETLQDYVERFYADEPILAEIAFCESTFRQFDSSGRPLRGKVNKEDVGVMQINEKYHGARAERMGLDLETLDGNLAYAKSLYEREGARPWSSSKPCWGKTAAYRELSVR